MESTQLVPTAEAKLAACRAANQAFLRGLIGMREVVEARGVPNKTTLLFTIDKIIRAAGHGGMAAANGELPDWNELFGL